MKAAHLSVDFMSHQDNIVFRMYSLDLNISQNEHINYPEVHVHHCEEFHYVYSGSVTIMLEGNKPDIVLNKGDFCLIPAGTYHCSLSESVSRVIFQVEIESGKSKNKASNDSYTALRNLLNYRSLPIVFNTPAITSAMLQFRELQKKEALCRETHNSILLMNAVMYAINSLTAEAASCSALSQNSSAISAANKRKLIIEHHIDDFFNAKDGLKPLATKLYLSERRTSEVVREVTGMNFKDLVVKERMTVASILIKSQKYPLEKIAGMVGYDSYSGFYTAYKKYFGHPPTDDVL